jgi:copper(I)-binding protein
VIRSRRGAAKLRRLLLVPLAVAIPLLAGCEAGNNAPVLDFHFPTDGAGTTVGGLSIANVFILGAPLGSSLMPGQSASLFLAVTNTGRPDRLLGISAPGSAISVHVPAGGILVASQHRVLLSGPQPQVYLVGLTRPLTSGSSITVVLHFLNAGAVSLAVPILPRAGHLTTLAPAPSPTPPAPAGAHKAHHKTGISPSPTPSSSPSA